MHTEEIALLNRLLSICDDARNFYRAAAGRVSDPRLEDTFHAFAQIRSEIAVDLTRLIRDHGGEPALDGTFEGKASQFFGELSAARSPQPERELLKHLSRAEDRSLGEFREALDESRALPPGTKRMLAGHVALLRETHDRMESLAGRYPAQPA
jgi:uncharacterized protein (TIGR02284 family)